MTEPREGADYGYPYDWTWHGPWTIDLAEPCECGGWRHLGDGPHDVSPDHIRGLLANLTDDRIDDALAALENGLGWAASESMTSYRWTNDEELLALVREALRRARSA